MTAVPLTGCRLLPILCNSAIVTLITMTIGARFWSSRAIGWRICRIAVVSCILVVASVMLLENNLIYFPSKYPEGSWAIPLPRVGDGEVFPKIEDCWFRTDDAVRLHGWYCSPVRREAEGTAAVPAKMALLWFHGNAGNITHRYDMISQAIKLPVEIFIIDYRGYGRSEGSPSEAGLYLDARAAWRYLLEDRKLTPERIVIARRRRRNRSGRVGSSGRPHSAVQFHLDRRHGSTNRASVSGHATSHQDGFPDQGR